MTKLLNLDELPAARIERTIVLNGKRHEMTPLSVGQFIQQQKMAESLKGNTDPAKELDALIEMIASVFPTMAAEDLKALSFDRLQAIFNFLQDQTPEVPPEAREKAGN